MRRTAISGLAPCFMVSKECVNEYQVQPHIEQATMAVPAARRPAESAPDGALPRPRRCRHSIPL